MTVSVQFISNNKSDNNAVYFVVNYIISDISCHVAYMSKQCCTWTEYVTPAAV